MKPTIGYIINTVRWNGVAAFVVVQIMCLYVSIVRPDNLSAVFEALWYAAGLDSFVSLAIVIGLKNRKRV